MLKPDVSWFSQVRMLGGVVGTGSSYPTTLVSSLAAHTYSNLREPSPDLVKALLINAAERNEHDAKLGCPPGLTRHEQPWLANERRACFHGASAGVHLHQLAAEPRLDDAS